MELNPCDVHSLLLYMVCDNSRVIYKTSNVGQDDIYRSCYDAIYVMLEITEYIYGLM